MCADFILDDANSMLGGSSFGVGGSGSAVPDPKLVNFASSLNKIFKSNNKKNPRDNQPNTEDFRVFLKEEPKNTNSNYNNGHSGGSQWRRGAGGGGGSGGGSDKKRVLNYWCFSPGVAMEDLKALGVRSLILTSGTLSPMDAFKEDMKVPFKVELENPHVIDRNQIWISALASGVKGSQLLSTYEKRDTSEYKDELGKSILSICQHMLGGQMNTGTFHPKLNGGVLVFFPSYGTMDSATVRWKETGLWSQLSQVMGKVVAETQAKKNNWSNKSNTSNTLTPYNRNEKWSSEGKQNNNWKGGGGSTTTHQSAGETNRGEEKDTDIVAGIIQEFEGALSQHGKCLLLAVCRGKVSEGIDFKDNKGRVAIMTGIPFSPFMDPWVVLKKKYLDDNCQQKGLFFDSTPTSGQDAKKHILNKPQYKPPAQYQPSSQYKPSSLILSGTMQTIKPGGGQVVSHAVSGTAASSSSNSRQQNNSSQRLTGQAWYVQSASRAVNQALGRVIRHKRDWGAVFLLDNRYQKSDQQQQLSGWIRPCVSKHANFSSALSSFRSFCTAALQNKDLALKVDVKQNVTNYRKPFVPPTQDKSHHSFQKSMVVPSSALMDTNAGEEDIHYINPSLAMSQNSFATSTDRESKQGFSLTKSTRSSNNNSSSQQQHGKQQTEINSISRMFTTIKSSKTNNLMPTASMTGSVDYRKTQTQNNQTQMAPFKSPLEHSHENVLAKKMREQGDRPLSGSTLGSRNVALSSRGSQLSRKLSQNDAFTSAPRGGTLSKSTTATTTTAAAAVAVAVASSSSAAFSNSQLSQSKNSGNGAFFNMSTVQASAAAAEKKRKAEGKVKFKALIGMYAVIIIVNDSLVNVFINFNSIMLMF